MLNVMRVLIVVTLMSVLLGMALPSPSGTWRGKLHGRAGLDVTLSGTPNHLRGTAVLYAPRGDGGMSAEPVPVRNTTVQARTVRFDIEPHLAPARTLQCEMILDGPNRAEVAIFGDPVIRLQMVRVP